MNFKTTGHTIHSSAANSMPAAEPTRHVAYQEQPTCLVVGHTKPAWFTVWEGHKHLRYMSGPPLKGKTLLYWV